MVVEWMAGSVDGLDGWMDEWWWSGWKVQWMDWMDGWMNGGGVDGRFSRWIGWMDEWLGECNVNLLKLLSTRKSHVRETRLFIGTIPNQVRNSQTFRFGAGSKSGKIKPRRQRGATVVTVGGGGRVVAVA